MITFEQFATWMSVFIAVGNAMLFAGAYLIARHIKRDDQRRTEAQVKDDILMAERKRAKQEITQAAAQRAGE